MRISMAQWASAAAVALAITSFSPGAHAESVMKVCADQYKQAQANGTTNGEAWPQFLQHCKTQQSVAATPAAAAPPPAAPAPAPASTTVSAAGSRPLQAISDGGLGAGQGQRNDARTKLAGTILRDARRGANRRPPSRGPGGCRRRRPPTHGARRSRAKARRHRHGRRRVHHRSAGESPLPVRPRGVGEYQVQHLPLPRVASLREHAAGRLHVRGGRQSHRPSRVGEREAADHLNARAHRNRARARSLCLGASGEPPVGEIANLTTQRKRAFLAFECSVSVSCGGIGGCWEPYAGDNTGANLGRLKRDLTLERGK